MPDYDHSTSLKHLAAIQKWQKHFKAKGCSQGKVFTLAHKYALKEMQGK